MLNASLSLLIFLNLNLSYLCDEIPLDLSIRNNINGDYALVKDLADIEPGAILNLKWGGKSLMLPFSPRLELISFSDNKWDWQFSFDENKNLIEDKPTLYELLPRGEYKAHICKKRIIN